MESLAYLHLALAREQSEGEQQTSEQASVGGNIGSSWDAAGWDEIFKTLDEEEEGEIEEWIEFSDTSTQKVIEVPEIHPRVVNFNGCIVELSKISLHDWEECQNDPGYPWNAARKGKASWLKPQAALAPDNREVSHDSVLARRGCRISKSDKDSRLGCRISKSDKFSFN